MLLDGEAVCHTGDVISDRDGGLLGPGPVGLAPPVRRQGGEQQYPVEIALVVGDHHAGAARWRQLPGVVHLDAGRGQHPGAAASARAGRRPNDRVVQTKTGIQTGPFGIIRPTGTEVACGVSSANTFSAG